MPITKEQIPIKTFTIETCAGWMTLAWKYA